MRVTVHATAAARRTHVGGQHDGALRVSVTAPADRGRANKAIIKALAEAFDVSRSLVELTSGATHRRKVFFVSNPPSDLAQRVEDLMQLG